MLLSSGEFHENRLTAGRIFLWASVQLHLHVYCDTCDVLNVKNALVKSAHSVTKCSISNRYCVCVCACVRAGFIIGMVLIREHLNKQVLT
jgi:hypothetical protein